MLKYLHPLVLSITGLGFVSIVYDIYTSMWATNTTTVVCSGIIIMAFWISMVQDYFNDRKLKKMLDNR